MSDLKTSLSIKEAISAIKSNWPPENYTMLREALTMAVAALETLPKYEELLYGVSMKHPNETRHETALRYIRGAESLCNGPAQVGDKP
jgi:hypothetical protein